MQVEQLESEEFAFPFCQVPDLQHDEMFSFRNDNRNTYNLKNWKDPLTDRIPLGLQPTPVDQRASNNMPPVRLIYGGQQNQNQVNVPTILKNPAWSTEKYNAVEDLKKTKANMSMFDMLQNCPQQWEALMKTLDQTKVSHNTNNIPQKIVPQQVNVVEAMPTMFKDKVEVPPFLLSIKIYGKNLHNCLIDSRTSCNVMPLSIAQRLRVSHQPSNQVVIQLDKTEVKLLVYWKMCKYS